MRKSKNRYFYHIFVFPGDAPGAITLNVIWMERECDAYKLPCWMCPPNYNRFWDRARYWSKIVIFHTPLHSTPPLRRFPSKHRHPVWYGKTRMAWLPDGEKISKISLFVLAQVMNVTDGRTDTGWQHIPRLCIASRGKNLKNLSLLHQRRSYNSISDPNANVVILDSTSQDSAVFHCTTCVWVLAVFLWNDVSLSELVQYPL